MKRKSKTKQGLNFHFFLAVCLWYFLKNKCDESDDKVSPKTTYLS